MQDGLRTILVYVIAVGAVLFVWGLGHAEQLNDRAEIGYYPAASPELFKTLLKSSSDQCDDSDTIGNTDSHMADAPTR